MKSCLRRGWGMHMTSRHKVAEFAPRSSQVELSGYRPAQRLRSLVRREGVCKRFDRSQKLFKKGDAASHIVLIEEGIIAISDGGHCGQRQILDFVFRNKLITPALSQGEPNHFTAECLTATTASVLSLNSVQRILATEPELNLAMLDVAFSMLDGVYARLSSMLCSHGTHRMAFLLAYLHDAHAASAANDLQEGLPIKQVDLAAALGVTAPYLNQIIKKMKSNGLIDTAKGKIKILQIEKIKDLIEDIGHTVQ